MVQRRLKFRFVDGQRLWPALCKFAALPLLTAILFLLAQTMVRHHFFSGGAQNNGNHPTGP
jgi:hypothetical protein